MNWIVLSTGILNLDQIVKVQLVNGQLLLSTAFRDLYVAPQVDVDRVLARLTDLASRWDRANPEEADILTAAGR